MRLRSRLYLALNSLLGTPQKVELETYTRTEEIFAERTLPFMEGLKAYIRGRALIVGCGNGVEIEWHARRCDSVVARDVKDSEIRHAEERSKDLDNVECRLVADSLPFEEEFDVIFMHDACEHITDLEKWFSEYYRVLKPDGVLINQFSPLFYSPYGAHLQDALKLPWGHLIFGVESVVEVRNRFYPGHSKAKSWEELGLNRLTEKGYLKIIDKTGFRHEKYSYKTSKNLPIGWIPLFRNLFIVQVTNILRK